MNGRRVVVTGMGVVSSLGNDVNKFWNNLINGISKVDMIKYGFNIDDYPDLMTKFAAEAEPIETDDFHSDKKMIRRFDPFIKYAVYATHYAMIQAGLKDSIAPYEDIRSGVVLASGIGGMHTLMREHSVLQADGPRRVNPFFIPMQIVNMSSGVVGIEYGMRGPNYSVVTACASATHAIGTAYRHIKFNDADLMITGGSEATVNPLSIAGFNNIRALSTNNSNPKSASRPFDKTRDGFVLADGAGVVVLEEYEHAKKRGAEILAEIVGYGFTCDSHHITAPLADGSMAARSMSLAIEDCGINKEEVQYINAHGTSTPIGDKGETLAIKNVFGDYAYKLKVNSTKSIAGHSLGATGGIELIATIMSIRNKQLHPTINLHEADPDCDLDYVPNTAIDYNIEYALSNSFGFGGHNASILIKKI